MLDTRGTALFMAQCLTKCSVRTATLKSPAVIRGDMTLDCRE